jgi:uracil-DNA glycosylase
MQNVGTLHGLMVDVYPEWSVGKVRVFASYHPSAALRNLNVNHTFYSDFQKLRKVLNDEGILPSDI